MDMHGTNNSIASALFVSISIFADNCEWVCKLDHGKELLQGGKNYEVGDLSVQSGYYGLQMPNLKCQYLSSNTI